MRSTGVPLPKNRLSGFVRLAGAGEIIRVTDRDRVVAELGPPQRGRTETAREYGNNDPANGITIQRGFAATNGITIQRGFAATGSFATSRSSVPGHARARHEKTTLDRYSGSLFPVASCSPASVASRSIPPSWPARAALHVASVGFLRDQGQAAVLATHGTRMAAAAREFRVPLAAIPDASPGWSATPGPVRLAAARGTGHGNVT
jgi:antitoxin (DNA-binding transcriptional repressor) of toxin-antitoxin stability system